MLQAQTASVLTDHEPPDALPLTLKPGDVVNVGVMHPERPDYVWADDGNMCAGWVPLALIERIGDRAQAHAEYSSNQIAVRAGEQVRVFWKGSGHDDWWCENRDGDRGWLPASKLTLHALEGDDS